MKNVGLALLFLCGLCCTFLLYTPQAHADAPTGAPAGPQKRNSPPAPTITPVNFSTTVGTTFTQQVAKLVGVTNVTASQLQSKISWGDNSTTLATVVQEKDLVVVGTHTYTSTGSFTLTIEVVDTTGSIQLSGTTTATVTQGPAPAPMINLMAENINAVAGTPLSSQEVGRFTLTNPPIGEPLRAIINWGDGSATTDGITDDLTASGTSLTGPFGILGTHTYTQAGSFTITIQAYIANPTGKNLASQSSTSTATVMMSATTPTLTVTAQNIKAVQNQVFTQEVGVAQVMAPFDGAQFTATINWGDGSTSTAGTISGTTPLTISGTHTYSKTGTYTITVNVTEAAPQQANSLTASDTGTATVSPSLVVTGQPISEVALKPFKATLATLVGPTNPRTVSVIINWGDNTPPTPGSVQPGTAPALNIIGQHIYRSAGRFKITLMITDSASGLTTSTTTTATVRPKAPAASSWWANLFH